MNKESGLGPGAMPHFYTIRTYDRMIDLRRKFNTGTGTGTIYCTIVLLVQVPVRTGAYVYL